MAAKARSRLLSPRNRSELVSPSPLRILVVTLAWLCFCLPASAVAQTPSHAARAIATGQEAVALFEQGQYDEALAKFHQAEALYHSPVFLLYAGRSLRERGRWVEALATLRRVAAENLDSAAPPPWTQAKADAQREVAALAAEVPSVIVTVERGSSETQVTIDGNKVAAGERILLDPGQHRVVASDGDRSESQDVTLSPSATALNVVVVLPPAAAREAPKPSPPTTPVAEPKSGRSVPGMVFAGGGAAVLVAGGVVGVLALTNASAARDRLPTSCDDTSCLTSKKEAIEADLATPRRLATIADVLFVTGGVAVAVGVVLMIVHRGSKPRGTVGVSSHGGSLEVCF